MIKPGKNPLDDLKKKKGNGKSLLEQILDLLTKKI